MCTVVILRRPSHAWPVLLAANRDEMRDRPWRPPARHWPDRPEMVAGLDELAGGSWLGMNDHGVVLGVLNRPNALGPAPDKRSRGELVLDALDHADAADAADALSALDGTAYRPFNLVLADNRDVFWLRNDSESTGGRVEVFEVPLGVSLLTSHDLNDAASSRIARYKPKFEAASPPDPEAGDWDGWIDLLTDSSQVPGEGPRSAMAIRTDMGFETVSSSLIALPSMDRPKVRPIWHFAAGMPAKGLFRPVDFSPLPVASDERRQRVS
jgi:uncharacterized protein with NRDE domain